jgi:hypothetical protein
VPELLRHEAAETVEPFAQIRRRAIGPDSDLPCGPDHPSARSTATSVAWSRPFTRTPVGVITTGRHGAGRTTRRGSASCYGSRSDKPPYVTGNHGKEGTDARDDRNTHPAAAGRWGCTRGTPRRRRERSPCGCGRRPANRSMCVAGEDLGPGGPQLDGAPASRSAVGDVAGVAGAGDPPGAVSSLWGLDRARGLRGGQGARDHAQAGPKRVRRRP